MIKELFILGWRNMTHRQLRSWLTILGVVIGIAAIVSLITIGQGLENAIVGQFNVLGADKIRVVPEGLTGPPTGTDSGLTEDDVDVVKDTIGVDYAGEVIMSSGVVEYDNKQTITYVKGIDSSLATEGKADINVAVIEGDWFNKGESKVAVIGYGLANDVFDKQIRVKNNIIISGEKYKVVGILESVGEQSVDQVVYVSKEDAQEMFDTGDGVSFIYATVQEGEDLELVAEKVQNNLEQSRDDDNFQIYTPEQLMAQLGTILSVVQFILAGIAAISLFVGGIGIMNTMYTSVLERTKQIGVMKALGANSTQILSIFLMESGFIGLIGGIVGAILGTMFAYSVEGIATLAGYGYLKISIVWSVIIFSLVFAFVVGVVSGLYPAYRAGKLSPVEALRYE